MKDHLDGVGPGPVSCAHVAVALGDGRAHGQVPVLAVHVVGSRPRQGEFKERIFSDKAKTGSSLKTLQPNLES